jgi:hypothetical protein
MIEIRAVVLDFLKDGAWHGIGEILSCARKSTTPEIASQLYIKKAPKGRNRPLEDQIDLGVRWEVLKHLRILEARGQISRKGDIKDSKCEFKLGGAKVQMDIDDINKIQTHIVNIQISLTEVQGILAKYSKVKRG